MNGQLFQAQSLNDLQLDMVHLHQAAIRSEVATIRRARAVGALRARASGWLAHVLRTDPNVGRDSRNGEQRLLVDHLGAAWRASR